MGIIALVHIYAMVIVGVESKQTAHYRQNLGDLWVSELATSKKGAPIRTLSICKSVDCQSSILLFSFMFRY